VAAARPGIGDPTDEPGTLARGAAIGGIVAVFGAVVLVVLGGVFALHAGLVVVALFLGRFASIGVMSGAAGAGTRESRQAIALGLATGAVLLAQVGLWLWAGVEGGTLGLVDYLVQTYELLVPIQVLLAGGAAWLSTK
jgi:hypothetical protein